MLYRSAADGPLHWYSSAHFSFLIFFNFQSYVCSQGPWKSKSPFHSELVCCVQRNGKTSLVRVPGYRRSAVTFSHCAVWSSGALEPEPKETGPKKRPHLTPLGWWRVEALRLEKLHVHLSPLTRDASNTRVEILLYTGCIITSHVVSYLWTLKRDLDFLYIPRLRGIYIVIYECYRLRSIWVTYALLNILEILFLNYPI